MRGYDYTGSGGYFITICTMNREHLFGQVLDGEMRLNDFGNIVSQEWTRAAEVRKEITLDEFVVMPNHIHGIIIINNNDISTHFRDPIGATRRVAPTTNEITPPTIANGPIPRSIGAVIGQFKSITTKRINALREFRSAVWQRDYYEHVIRDYNDLNRIREYILSNPRQWDMDTENK